MDIQDLRLVRAIAEHGSLARAARVLGIGQPALTRSLAALEATLQGPLFERDRRGAVPTDLGRLVLAEAAGIIERLEALEARIGTLRGDQARDLAVAAGLWAAETIGVAAAARMLAHHPTLRIRLQPATWIEIPTLVREREAALGLLDIGGLGAPPDLVVEPLRPQPALFLVRPGHPLLAEKRPSLADAMAWPFVFLGRTPQHAQAPVAAARAAARAAGAVHPAFPALVVDSPRLGLGVLAESDAVTPAPAALAAAAIADGRAAALPLHAPWMIVRWGVIHRRGHRLAEAEEAFLDQLRSADREAEAVALGLMDRLGLAWPPG